MARRTDTGWRDSLLTVRHAVYGFTAPAPGMVLPMVEYDRGRAVGLVNYLRIGDEVPNGPETAAAYRAFGRLADAAAMDHLPFLTAAYDPVDWSMALFPHNDAAQALVGRKGWTRVVEADFAALLYQMRGKVLPDLSCYGVRWNDTMWTTPSSATDPGARYEKWRGQAMSQRRREYEPTESVPFGLRVPCLDIDLAVIGPNEYVSLVVDYKAAGARLPTNLSHPNYKALASLASDTRSPVGVAAYVVEYAPVKPAWQFRVHCLNKAAELHLAYSLGHTNASTGALASAVVGDQWVSLTEAEWLDVLRCARDL